MLLTIIINHRGRYRVARVMARVAKNGAARSTVRASSVVGVSRARRDIESRVDFE